MELCGQEYGSNQNENFRLPERLKAREDLKLTKECNCMNKKVILTIAIIVVLVASFLIGTGFMATAVATMIFPPLGIVTGILAGVWAWITGKDTKVEQNRQHFKTELAKMFDKMHSSLVDVQDGRERSVVGEFIYTLKKNAEKVIQNSVSSKKDEMEEQLRLFESQAKLSIQEKQQECVRLKNSLTEWNNLVPRLGELCNLREMIEKEVNENQNVR